MYQILSLYTYICNWWKYITLSSDLDSTGVSESDQHSGGSDNQEPKPATSSITKSCTGWIQGNWRTKQFLTKYTGGSFHEIMVI